MGSFTINSKVVILPVCHVLAFSWLSGCFSDRWIITTNLQTDDRSMVYMYFSFHYRLLAVSSNNLSSTVMYETHYFVFDVNVNILVHLI